MVIKYLDLLELLRRTRLHDYTIECIIQYLYGIFVYDPHIFQYIKVYFRNKKEATYKWKGGSLTYDQINFVLDNLSTNYINTFGNWFIICKILKHIDNRKLYHIWLRFSSKCTNFDKIECDRWWFDRVYDRHLGYGYDKLLFDLRRDNTLAYHKYKTMKR